MATGKQKNKKTYTLDEAKMKLGDLMISAWIKNSKKITTESEEELIKKILLDFDRILADLEKVLDAIVVSTLTEELRPEEAYR